MTDNGEHRLSDDPELLERFVLETLEQDERAKLEDHLRTCEPCRKAVQVERLIAAGARRLGRDEAKERLARRMSLEQDARIPWRALAAAAVIIMLIGVGITFRWFAVREPSLTSPELGQVRAPAAKEEQRAPAEERYATPPTVHNEEAAPASHGGAAKNKIQNAPAAGAPRAETRYENLAAADKARPAMEEKKSNTTGLSAGSLAYWTEGTLLQQSGPKEARLTDALQKPAAAARVEKDAGAPTPQNTTALFSIRQRSAAQLPQNRQGLQIASNQVQTLVEQRDDGVHLTLYLDSLVDETALKNSTVRQVGPDSAIVQIANQQIGYRIPSLQQQIPSQNIRK
jgi:hypothetical protein